MLNDVDVSPVENVYVKPENVYVKLAWLQKNAQNVSQGNALVKL